MGRRKAPTTKRQHQQPRPRLVDHLSSDDSDEEIPEEEAFNSDDDRKYGSFFQSNDDESGDESSQGLEEASDEDIGSEEEEEGDGGQYMLDLLNKLDEGEERREESNKTKSSKVAAHMKESEFASSVVPKASLTLDALMEGLEDTKGFGVVQKQMKKVAQGSATAAPLARVVSDRAKRKVHYQDQSKEVSQWIDAVQQNRQAETLDFRPKERMEVTKDVLVDKFVPTTDFEKQLHAALLEAGQKDEESMLKAEEAALQDDLGANRVTLEEYKKRRGELAKMRALMFYYEQKQHQIKKIKSKKYRRIRKRQRERQKGAELEAQVEENPDLAKELEEKEEIERMKERMTLAHKNTSKWAKRVLKRGKNVDIDTRRALSAQLKRGEDLLNRMTSTRSGEEDDDSEEEDLIDTARKVLADTEDKDDGPIQGKGLFKLSFMQKGVEKQRQRAREEARQLLLELEANEEEQGLSPEGDDDDRYEENMQKSKKAKVASKEDMKGVLRDGDLVTSSLKFGNSSSLAVSGGIRIDLESSENELAQAKGSTKTNNVSEHSTVLKAAEVSTSKNRKAPKEETLPTDKKTKATAPPKPTTQDDINPWMSNEPNGSSKKVKKAGNAGRMGMVDVERAVDLLEPDSTKDKMLKRGAALESTNEDPRSDDKKITTLTQEELVRRAFATPSEKEAEEEFAKEKQRKEDQEDPTRKQKKEKEMSTVAGWGTWAGEGAPPPRPPRKLPKHLQPPEKKKLPKRKRVDEKKPDVIISEKRIKKTADKFMIAQVPYPFSSREEYERSMVGGVGREWNVSSSFKDMTRPEIVTRSGKVIQPISKKVKRRRPAAKF